MLVSYRRLVQILLRVSLEISRIKVKSDESDVSKRQAVSVYLNTSAINHDS